MKKIIFGTTLILSSMAYAQVGINTQNPQGIFNIDGLKDNATSGVPTNDQQANDFAVLSSGNVGIGTTSPSTKLEVQFSGSSAYATVARFLASGNATIGNTTQLNFGVSSSSGNSAEWRFVYQGDNNDANRIDFGMNNVFSPMITYMKNGNVGIGNSNPLQRLDVSGTGLFRNGNTANSFTTSQILFGFIGTNQYQHAIKTRHNVSSLSGNAIDFFTWKQGTDGSTTVGTQHVLTLDGNANVGIGTTTPISRLEINGASTNSTAFNAASATSIDYTKSNLAYTTASPGTFTLTGLKDGGTYTLAVQGTTQGTASFSGNNPAGVPFVFKSLNNGITTSGKETLYTFIVMGSRVYFFMSTGF